MKYFLLVLLAIGFASYPAFAKEIPIQIRTVDNDLFISGTIDDTNGNPVSILIKNQSDELILVSQIMPKNGVFSLEVKRQGPLWDNIQGFSVRAFVPDQQATLLATKEKIYREGVKSENNTTHYVDFQTLEASQSKCTILGLGGKETCNLQAFLTLGMFTSAIIGAVITISMITLRRSMRKNL